MTVVTKKIKSKSNVFGCGVRVTDKENNMQIFLLILFGFLSGIIGGMGMGGGTLLTPLLSFLDLEQKTIQAINLISFLPMCCVALGFHAKNKLIKTGHIWWIIIPAVAMAVAGALCADMATNKILRMCFAAFLISVGIWQLVVAIKFIVKNKKQSNLPVIAQPMLPSVILDAESNTHDQKRKK